LKEVKDLTETSAIATIITEKGRQQNGGGTAADRWNGRTEKAKKIRLCKITTRMADVTAEGRRRFLQCHG